MAAAFIFSLFSIFSFFVQVECCIRALAQGVNATHIIDGRSAHSLLQEILTNEGVGTMIVGGK